MIQEITQTTRKKDCCSPAARSASKMTKIWIIECDLYESFLFNKDEGWH